MMPMTAIALLVLFAVALVRVIYKDAAEYQRFKALTESRDRQRRFAVWVAKSFILFGAGAVVSLALVGQLPALMQPPAAFAPLTKMLRSVIDLEHGGSDVLTGFAGGVLIALLFGWLILRFRSKKKAPKQVTVGDIQPLLPRNGAERWWAVLLSVNAGLSEELFFRLALPLLIVLVIGNVVLAFAVAVVVFALMHLYQGWAGVLATGLVGAALSAVYLASGNIWIAVALHAALDLNALVVMPLLTRTARESAQ
jgi:membrane protease YdiL (CAAX protease family)